MKVLIVMKMHRTSRIQYKPFVYKQNNICSYKIPLHKSKLCKTKWNFLNKQLNMLTEEDYISKEKMKYIELLIDDLRNCCYLDDLENLNEFDYITKI